MPLNPENFRFKKFFRENRWGCYFASLLFFALSLADPSSSNSSFLMRLYGKAQRRSQKKPKKIYQILDDFESVKPIYKGRYVVERTFAWEDAYRRLDVRRDRLAETFNGFRFMAYSLINFR